MMELVGCVPTCEWDLMALEMSASVMPSTEEARSGWPHSCTASGCRLSVHSLDRLLNRRRGLWCNPWAGTELGQRKDRRKPTGGRQPARTVLSLRRGQVNHPNPLWNATRGPEDRRGFGEQPAQLEPGPNLGLTICPP